MKSLTAFQLQPTHSAALTANSTETKIALNWRPEMWVIVARLTAGYINIHMTGKSANYVKIDNGTVRLPVDSQEIMIETVGATGWWSAYAISGLDGFEVVS